MDTSSTLSPDTFLVGFSRALRSAGLAVTQDRTQTYLRAVACLGLGDRRATYWAGRATLCSGPEDIAAYDKVFSEWFLECEQPGSAHPQSSTVLPNWRASAGDGSADGPRANDEQLSGGASDAEVLRQRDIATLSAAERDALASLLNRLKPIPPRRTSYRRRTANRGLVDARATLRRMLDRMGEPGEIARRRRSTRHRRVVLLIDVSGSMNTYADALLGLAHRVSRSGETEVFSVGTRLTRLTRAMHDRDPARALAAAGEAVPDWAGGTRLGDGLKAFLDNWGQRGLVRRAVVVVFSDGWERGDARLLAEQMARLHRLAHRVVWVNPHKSRPGYAPVQRGMAAALPYVDDFVAGHSLAALQEVIQVIADA